METAVSCAEKLRRLGFEPARVSVGDVSFDLVIRVKVGSGEPMSTPAPAKSLAETYGGPGFSEALGGGAPEGADPAGGPDDDVTAVR